jgi:hypothetical protein
MVPEPRTRVNKDSSAPQGTPQEAAAVAYLAIQPCSRKELLIGLGLWALGADKHWLVRAVDRALDEEKLCHA